MARAKDVWKDAAGATNRNVAPDIDPACGAAEGVRIRPTGGGCHKNRNRLSEIHGN